VFSIVTLDPRLLAVFAAVYILSAPFAVLTRRFRGASRTKQAPIPSPRSDDVDTNTDH